MEQKVDEITIIGAGKFGTAVAEVIAHKGEKVTLVTRSRDRLPDLEKKFSKQKKFDVGVLDDVTLGSHVFIAIPSSDFPELVPKLVEHHDDEIERSYISLSKGLTVPLGETPLELLIQKFGRNHSAMVSGPSLAHEMSHHLTRLIAASENALLSRTIATLLESDLISCKASADPHGVEFAAIAKNISTLAFHAAHKATDSLNTAGSYASSIFDEMFQYAQTFGTQVESFMGIAGVGDLLTTSHAPVSRNKRAGDLLGSSEDYSIEDIEGIIKQTVESLHSIPLLQERIDSSTISAPAISLLNQRVTQEISHQQWVKELRVFS